METSRQVLITGGSRGIGRALATRYLAAGARVIVTGRSMPALRTAQRDLEGLEVWSGDIGRADARESLAAHVLDSMPDLDMVINNAGMQRRVALAQDEAPWEEREEELRILLAAPVHLNHLLIPHLLAGGRPATIVNVSSGGAFVPQPFAPLYSAAKSAVHSYTVNLRYALAETRVGVVELVPPAVATGLAGAGSPHGASLDDFADAAYAGLVAGRPVIGFGPTATQELQQQLERETATFETSSGRFPVVTYEGQR